jgi:hypothetical protein
VDDLSPKPDRRRQTDARALAFDCLREAESAAASKGEGVTALLMVKAVVFAILDVADALRESNPFTHDLGERQ